ncbi:hypothetical protein J5N97_005733 [Dioscorea zingiberensis]|uniref:ZC3H15/TMA46 family C-terminal domain-containing protein n=1 Tax=Dioscorea zingiberensis TaxID=325984 RepID=A0A9D5HTB2_9LILI|nr:hypothetical protein J5N97_005733 [Dioscorea zingiberensis]
MGAEEERRQQRENGVAGLGTGQRLNLITETQFQAWKRRKDADASARKEAATRKRSEDIISGTVQMNGRELFQHEPWQIYFRSADLV